MGGGDLPMQLASFPTDFACDQVTAGCCNCYKCKLVAMCPDHDQVTARVLRWLELLGSVIITALSTQL